MLFYVAGLPCCNYCRVCTLFLLAEYCQLLPLIDMARSGSVLSVDSLAHLYFEVARSNTGIAKTSVNTR